MRSAEACTSYAAHMLTDALCIYLGCKFIYVLWLAGFKNVSYDVFEIACTKSGGDLTSHSFLTWLLDLSGT